MQQIYLYITAGSFLKTNIYNGLLLPIYNDTILAVASYLIPSAFSGILALMVFDFTFLMLGQKRRNRFRIMTGKTQTILFLLFTYITFVFFLAILSRPPGSRTDIDLMPLATFSHRLEGNIYTIENIILFMPFGFLLSMLFTENKQLSIYLLCGVTLSITIELAQYLTQRGYLQTDDVLLNVLGCILGHLISRSITDIAKRYILHSG
jgi:glycopeptide antibiotics resistance protein